MTVLATMADGTEDPTLTELIAARPQLTMHAMSGLVLEDAPLTGIAAALGTPCWVYGAATIRSRLARLRAALDPLGAEIHYAVKANDHLAVLGLFARAGVGADVVSEGELARALRAGIAPAHIVFSGVGKTTAEICAALAARVGQINVESAAELAMVAAAAAAMGCRAPVAVRINPDVDANTHSKITTGRAGDKFGVAQDEVIALYEAAAADAAIEPVGLALHIGSQVMTLAPYRAAFARAAALILALRARGQVVRRMDCGGGLGIAYRGEADASPEALAGALAGAFAGLDLQLMVEPGRWLVGPAGVLLASVVLTKHHDRILVLDAAMNDLVRPAMYDAWHGIVPLSAVDAAGQTRLVDVVGPVCESGDTFARARALPSLTQGARVAILDAGAYGAVMSSTYNSRPLIAAAMVDGASWEMIRPRQRLEALWADETIPGFVRQ